MHRSGRDAAAASSSRVVVRLDCAARRRLTQARSVSLALEVTSHGWGHPSLTNVTDHR
jgi:hypothetical protein